MTERALVLIVLMAAALFATGVYSWWRKRPTAGPERLPIDDLGLELMAGCCAFVVFTSPSCRPCKAALAVVGGAAEASDGFTQVVAVDATQHPTVAARCKVATIPTVFLVTASGHVVRRWKTVPDGADVQQALELVASGGAQRSLRRRAAAPS